VQRPDKRPAFFSDLRVPGALACSSPRKSV
jgi:hypothetical protein